MKSGEVYSDKEFGYYDVMLNQTNITQGRNNNKFYVIQLIKDGTYFELFTRWGRVGEVGTTGNNGYLKQDQAIAAFNKKYKDKTGTAFLGIKGTPKAVPGKYIQIEMKESTGNGELLPKVVKNNVQSKLNPKVLELIRFIFDYDMFKSQMQEMEINVDEMPLGAISEEQVEKGRCFLNDIRKMLIGNTKVNSDQIRHLSSQFYTHVPHKFSRSQVPTPLNTMELLQKKFDLCNMLSDIEQAQSILKIDSGDSNIDDKRFEELKCMIEHVPPSEEEFSVIKNYFDATKPNNLKLLEVYRIDRSKEGDRYKSHDDIDHRRMLWHGTNVAVVVAILKSGLRIMPHSGGRVGRGIYFASQLEKSAYYIGYARGGEGFVFLSEVALGKPKEIYKDDSSLKKAPTGYDSVLAKGKVEPDPSKDIEMEFEGKNVVIPQGKPKPVAGAESSYFLHSEYLVYKESQARLRYILKIKR